jgi:hypothetical protein
MSSALRLPAVGNIAASQTNRTQTPNELDLWLRYKSKKVDLACLKPRCKVKAGRMDSP